MNLVSVQGLCYFRGQESVDGVHARMLTDRRRRAQAGGAQRRFPGRHA
jgi:hypothetical protein